MPPLSRYSATRYAHYETLELFRGVHLTAVEHLLSYCTEMTVELGTVLLEQGTSNDALYQIVDGEVEVHLNHRATDPIVTLGPGSCVGELSIVSGVDASAHVIAVKPTVVLIIPAPLVWSFTASSHEFARNLLDVIAGRVRADNRRLLASIDAQEHFQLAARVDALTGLYNRRWFEDALKRQTKRAQKDVRPLSAVFVDIDNFKAINDEYGHLVGDNVLRSVAEVLQAGIRSIDVAARFGGEEFILLLYGINLTEAREIAERLRREVEMSTFELGGSILEITISAGVAELCTDEDADEFIHAADIAMYAAKRSGKNQVAVRP